jgi:hypothetical protein
MSTPPRTTRAQREAAAKTPRSRAQKGRSEAPTAASEPEVKPPARPAPPDNLGPAGEHIWREVVKVYDLRPDELRILEDACREATLIDRIHAELTEAPLIVKGSMGQPAASPLVQEVRQHRVAFAALVGRLKLPDAPEELLQGAENRAVKARAAANARWRR